MSQLAASIAISLRLAEERAAADHRRADAWRRLHARPDALPEPVRSVPVARRQRFAGLLARRARSTQVGG
jgi:hypothetical protein